MPKSSSFGTPASVTRMLVGLMSRWTIEAAVRVAHRPAHDQEQAQPIGHRQPARVAVAVDRHALHVLHDQVRQAVVGRAAVEQAGDVRVLEPGQDLALGPELAHPFAGRAGRAPP